MTQPYERYSAVLRAREFLLELADTALTPRLPSKIRNNARWLLKHFPGAADMSVAADACPSVFAKRMFGDTSPPGT